MPSSSYAAKKKPSLEGDQDVEPFAIVFIVSLV